VSGTDWGVITYFTRDEFGYAPGVEPDPELVLMLEWARQFSEVPFVITSGIRTPEHNREVGGKAKSAHLSGHAVDIACTSSAVRREIVGAVVAAGFDRIGIAKTFVHVDTHPDLPNPVMWLY